MSRDEMKARKKALEFIQKIQADLLCAERVDLRQMDSWRTFNDCTKELQMVDGAMQNVGEAEELGTSYELRITVKRRSDGRELR